MINFEQIQNKINQAFGGEALSQKSAQAKPEFNLIADLLPYRSFNELKQIFINDNSVGFVLEATPLIGATDNVIDTLSGMFSDALPEGCTIQFINFASPKVGPLFDAWKASRFAQGGIYKKLAEKRIAHFKTANHQSIFNSSPFTLKNFRLIISVSLAIKKSEASDLVGQVVGLIAGGDKSKKNEEAGINELLTQIAAFKETFKTTLRTAGIPSTEMAPEHLINFVDEIINFNVATHKQNLKYDPLDPINKQIIDPENFLKIEADQLTVFADNDNKKTHIRCFSVRNFPNNWAQWQCRDLIGDYFQDLRRMEYPFLTSFSVTLPYNEDSLKAKAKAKNFNATRLQGSELSKFIPEMKTSAAEWRFVTEKINSGQRILKTVYQAVIFAPSDKINEAEQTLKDTLKNLPTIPRNH